MERMRIASVGLLIALSLPAVGQGVPAASGQLLPTGSATPPAAPSGLHERNPQYQVRKGDSFYIDFAFAPEFDQTLSVQPDGYVTFKEIGPVFVEGQSVPQLTQTVKDAYAKILHDPVVTVALRDFEKPYFIAAGQVGRPGKYELRSALTVTEAVAIAGGFTEKSKHSEVAVYRPVSGGQFEVKILNIKKLLAKHDLSEDLRLEPGDVVYVPQNSYSKIRPYIPSPTTGAGLYYSPVPY